MNGKKLQEKLKNSLFNIGTFFEIRWFNPLYLDKSGEAMKIVRQRYSTFGISGNDIIYYDKKFKYEGQLSVEKYWLKINNQNYYSDTEFKDFFDFIKEDLRTFIKVYEITDITRIGFRVQGLWINIKKDLTPTFNNILHKSILGLKDIYSLQNKKIVIQLNDKIPENPKTNLHLGFSQKTAGFGKGPLYGFLIDADYFKAYTRINAKKGKFLDFTKEADIFLRYFLDNYPNIISKLLSKFKFMQ